MISIGIDQGGPESLPVVDLLCAAMRAVEAALGEDSETGKVPSVNVVFYVPGSVSGHEGLKKLEAARFSRKRNLLLVAVPVPKEQLESGGSIEFIIDALHKANEIAAETFSRKGTEPFDIERAERIVEKVRQSLMAGHQVM